MVSNSDSGGADQSEALLATPVGSDFTLWQNSQSGNFARWSIQGLLAKAGYVEFDLGPAEATGGTVQNGPCTLQLEVGGLPAEKVAAFQIYVFRNDVRDIKVGFAPDIVSASTLAASWLTAAEQIYPTPGATIGIVDTKTDLVVASVGWVKGGRGPNA